MNSPLDIPSRQGQVSDAEWQVRVDLAAAYRLVAAFHWDDPGFTIHSAIHAARHDARCVLHTHTLNGVAVSAQKHGVLPRSRQSIFVLARLACHDDEGVALREDEKARQVTRGQGAGALTWPGLLRRLDRISPGYRP